MKLYQNYTDEDLVSFVLSGDNDAYCELVSRYKKTVFGAVIQIVEDYHSAEDIAQEAFIDGFFRISALKEPAKISSWLYGIAKRKALNYATRRKKHEDIACYSEILFAENSSPEDEIIRNETEETVRRALCRLSIKNKAVAEMFYLEGNSVAGIAKKLCIPEGTVKSRLHDSRVKLKD